MSRARRDSVDIYVTEGAESVLWGRVKLVDGRIVAECLRDDGSDEQLQELITRPHGNLAVRGRLVGPEEGREFLSACVEQYVGIGMRAEWTRSR